MSRVHCTFDHITQCKELEIIRVRRGATIDKLEQQNIEKEIKKWKEILTRILDIAKFLSRQN